MPSRYGTYGPVTLPAASYDYMNLLVKLGDAVALSPADPTRDAKILAAINASIGSGIVVPIPNPSFSVQPKISPGSGEQTTTFTGTDGTPTNGSITGRRWLLNDELISTGLSVSNVAPGTLLYENTNTGLNGTKVTATSIAVTVLQTIFANFTTFYANNTRTSADISNVEQQLLAAGGSYSQYSINYGTGPNTATGDTVYAALVKLQNWVAALESKQSSVIATGYWNDAATWNDNQLWKDAA